MSGMPGTGKTASLLEAIRELQETKAQPFVFVHVNAMRLLTPNAVFSDILGRLPRSGRTARTNAVDEARSFFATRKKQDPVVVMLIDEIDQLVTKKQSVLYNVFDWLSLRSARLVVTAISNTMDLPERLMPRVASRFEIVRVDFWPYTRDQIHKILCERLRAQNATGAFQSEALRRCAARVAAGSGDVRKALQLCRRALELRRSADDSGGGQTAGAETPVDSKLIEASAKELLFANPASKAIAGLSRRTRRLLCCIVLELRHQESEMIPLRKVAGKYQKLTDAVGEGQEIPSEGTHAEDAAVIASRLESASLLAEGHAGKSNNGPDQGRLFRLGCGLDAEDLKIALLAVEDDPGMRTLLQES
jgi:Cdc6-like AAA superfamily ATPase